VVRRAAEYLVCNGPVSEQDRWENDAGYSPFTVAAEIAALLSAADMADLSGEPAAAAYLRETADIWNDGIERAAYATGTELAEQLGIEGYYVRIVPPQGELASSPAGGFCPIKNRPFGQVAGCAALTVSPDALGLVRFGLRRADDPRMVNTIRAIDARLRMETPCGPSWYRYRGDQYGEQADGRPYNGSGIGRCWPLLTGERAHYELAAGHRDEALRLLAAMEASASDGGMIPEQIWDAPDVPERELFFGKPSGSAMPLVWAHAEYVKLRRSLHDGRVFDLPPQTVRRYLVENVQSPMLSWRFNHKLDTIPAGKTLRIEARAPATVHWSADGWQTIHDTPTRDTTLRTHLVDLPTAELPPGRLVCFTFFWPASRQWEGADFTVAVE
jgi:glucoamylase